MQVTRGVAKRDHPFPTGVTPTVFMNSTPWPQIPAEQIENGVSAVTHADERWLHCDIKSISLLGNVLMKQHAMDHGASETVMLRDGFLTEGSSTNTMLVKGGVVIAPLKTVQILPGITYDAVFDIARAHGLKAERQAGRGSRTALRRRGVAELLGPRGPGDHPPRRRARRQRPARPGLQAGAGVDAAGEARRRAGMEGRA